MNDPGQRLQLVDESKLTEGQKNLLAKLKSNAGPSLDARMHDVLRETARAIDRRPGLHRDARERASRRPQPSQRAPAVGRLADDDLI